MPPLILALDTAFSRCTAAVFDAAGAGELLAAEEPEIGKGHAERLTGVIDDVLSKAGANYGDLARVVVTTGPGSFTGIRVGVAAARGLALALDIPAVGISTLEALARGLLARSMSGTNEPGVDASPVLAVIDARRGEIYAALFAVGGDVLEGPAALQPEALDGFLGEAWSAAPGMRLHLAGSGAPIAATALSGRPYVIASDTDRIDPAILARLGAAATAVEPPRPLYLRGADAKPSSAPSLRRKIAESIP